MERAEHGRFRQFLAQLFLYLAGRQDATAFEQLPGMGDERGDAIRACGPRCALPVAVATQSVDKGQRLGADEEVGMVTCGAEKVERQSGIRFEEAREQISRVLNRGARRRRVGLTQACLDERRRGRRNLRLARKKKAEAGLRKPGLRVVQGK